MKITILVENTPKDASIPAEHGLSFYIEGCGKRILLDAGQKSLFAENAARLRVDLAAVDFAVLSHGHGDHSGGLPAFRAANPAAPIYMARAATRRCYLRRAGILHFNVGMDRAFAKDALIAPLDADTELGPGVTAVVGIPRASAYLTTSDNLYMRKGLWFARDDFAHELALVMREDTRTFVFSSCSHTGLQNIMKRVAEAGLLGQEIRVFAGMHLFNSPGKRNESAELLDRLAGELIAYPAATYYAGHCTGQAAFDRLKATMGDRLQPLRCGNVFEF